VINWMLGLEDVEEVPCTLDDMIPSIVRELCFGGDGVREGGGNVRGDCVVSADGGVGARL
jgi:hypothetical protein